MSLSVAGVLKIVSAARSIIDALDDVDFSQLREADAEGVAKLKAEGDALTERWQALLPKITEPQS